MSTQEVTDAYVGRTTFALDIETAPDPDLVEAVLASPPTFKAPANYKDAEKISANLAKQRSEWEEKVRGKAGLTPLRGRVVAFALVSGEDGEKVTSINLQTTEGDERSLLVTLAEELAEAETLITFNGHSFDAPFVRLRMLRHGIKPPRILRAGRRYSNHPHFDVRMVLTDWDTRAEGTLEVFARFMLGAVPPDVPSPFTGLPISGGEVAELVEQGAYGTISDKCVRDTRMTWTLARRLMEMIR